nr:MAG TPA: hypothetical protein [Caudoviricetes sp.]
MLAADLNSVAVMSVVGVEQLVERWSALPKKSCISLSWNRTVRDEDDRGVASLKRMPYALKCYL